MKQKQQKDKEPAKEKNFRTGHRERLKQRFMKSNGKGVADHELLELILFRTIPRKDVKEIAHILIDEFGDLSAVMAAPKEKLQKVAGIGPHVMLDFKIFEEAALRFGQSRVLHRDLIASWDDLIRYCRAKMAEKRIEEFHVLFIDKQNRVIADETLAIGTVDHTPVYPREVIKRALQHDASAIIIVHNHPGGDPSPSRADIDMTHRLRDLAQQFNIKLHDHLVIGRNAEYSFRNQQLI
ncbi:MAG: RadC family protein [Parvibaculales bacterium]